MNFLLKEQAWWDTREFDPPNGYEQLPPEDQKIAHVQLHLAKAGLKLLNRNPNTIRSEVVPDLAIYRSQLINVLGIIPEEIEDPLAVDLMPLHAVIRATGHLASYLEPRQHGEVVPKGPVRRGVECIHNAALLLADHYDMDLEQAQRTRMEQRLGGPLPELAN